MLQIKGKIFVLRTLDEDKFEGISFYSALTATCDDDSREFCSAKLRTSMIAFLHLASDDEIDIETMDHFLMCTRLLICAECHFEIYHLFALYGIIKKTMTGGRDTFNYISLQGPCNVWTGGMTSTLAEMQILDIFDWKIFMFPGPGALACVVFRRFIKYCNLSLSQSMESALFRKLQHEACLRCVQELDFDKKPEEIAFEVAYDVFQKEFKSKKCSQETKIEIEREFYSEAPKINGT